MDMKKRIEKLEKDRQSVAPVQPPKIYKVQEISPEEWNAVYAPMIQEYARTGSIEAFRGIDLDEPNRSREGC